MIKRGKNKKKMVIARVFDALLERVWQAWTEPEEVKKWWGPKNFTAPTIKINFRPGGRYLFCMRGATGPDRMEKDYWSAGVYQEIIPMKKITVIDNFSDALGNIVSPSYYGLAGGLPLNMTVETKFEESAGKTKFTVAYSDLKITSSKERANMEQGRNESLDKLAASLK